MPDMNLPPLILLNKPVGISPLDAIKKYQTNHSEYQNVKLGYAGRLDPMAEGLLIILVGEENKKRKGYEQLPKEYEFTMLFGIMTDTYDILGLITKTYRSNNITKNILESALQNYIGAKMQAYPPYSAARVMGKPLYYWARSGNMAEISIPEKKINIYDIKFTKLESLKMEELRYYILSRIHKVKGDFRQEEIATRWKKHFDNSSLKSYLTAKMQITCSSGTYVRSVIHSIGQDIGTGATTLQIIRKKIGTYKLEDAKKVD